MLEWVRAKIERAVRNRSFRKRLPKRFQRRPIWVSGDARLRLLLLGTQGFDSELFDYVDRHVSAGDHVWDLGANVGQFALAAAHKVGASGRVLALEPDPFLQFLLYRTRQEAGNTDISARFEVMGAAAAASGGIGRLEISARGRASSHLGSVKGGSQTGGVRHGIVVPLVSLDSLLPLFGTPSLIKIDVEGAELEVISGGRKLLSNVRPRLLIEVANENQERASALLAEYGYQFFDPISGETLRRCSFNTLAVPRLSGG